VGYGRDETPAAVAALNALYRREVRLFENLFLPSVKLLRKERIGARVRRRYDAPRTPLDRVRACPEADPAAVARLVALREQLDPFVLSRTLDHHVEQVLTLATPPRSPAPSAPPRPRPRTPTGCRRRPPPPRHLPDFTFANNLRRPIPSSRRVTS
jgi:hypothetical protein